MPNTILTPTMVLRKSLQILHNNLGFTKGVNRQFDDQFGGKGAKNGDTIKARLPNRATVRTGSAMSVQDTEA